MHQLTQSIDASNIKQVKTASKTAINGTRFKIFIFIEIGQTIFSAVIYSTRAMSENSRFEIN